MRTLVLCAVLLLNVFSMAAVAAEYLDIEDIWLRESVPGSENGAAFGVFANPSDQDIVIVGVDSDAADRVEIHQHVARGNEMRMEEIEALPVAAGEKVTLQPGGYHIMLFALADLLKIGDEYNMTIYLSNGDQVTVKVPVRSLMHGQDKAHQH